MLAVAPFESERAPAPETVAVAVIVPARAAETRIRAARAIAVRVKIRCFIWCPSPWFPLLGLNLLVGASGRRVGGKAPARYADGMTDFSNASHISPPQRCARASQLII